MTIAPNHNRVPQFQLGHRLALAREVAGLDQADLARELEVARTTISNYETGRSRPNRLQLNAWAVMCGVDVEWLKTGTPQGDRPLRGANPRLLD